MTMIAGPSPRRTARLGWATRGVLVIAAAFWFAERIVDWLWMGGMGYRAVFWRILDLRFGLFAAALVPLALVFWINLRWALRMMEGWRRATGAPIDPALAGLERSGLLRRALPGLLAIIVAIAFAGILGRCRPLPLWRELWSRGSAARPRRRLLRVSAAAARGNRARSLLRCARAACCPSGVGGRARGVPRLGAAPPRGAGLDGDGARQQSRRSRARAIRELHPRPLPAALRRGRHCLGPRLRRRARGDADALADGRDRTRGGGTGGGVRAPPRPASDSLGYCRRFRRARRPAGHPSGGDPCGLCRPNELARERPYLEHNIAFTRRAFGIDGVPSATIGQAEPEMRDLADWRPCATSGSGTTARSFGPSSQFQPIRLYYQFYDVDVDRYPWTTATSSHARRARADAGASRARRPG